MGISSILAAASPALGFFNASKAAKSQKKAMQQSARDAEAARVQADREFNKANQKAPNVAALYKRNKAAGSGGTGGTFLTGTSGAATSGGMLGRTTLLGG